jgi:tetratricopeptide (TPR) repeat protein
LQRTRRLVRRNPALAAATAVTMLLLLVIAGLLAWFNHRRGIALEQIGREYNRAETNLRDKTRALIEADRQRQRAAGNLEMALAAFAGVIDNIGARGGSDALLDELQEDATLVDASEAMLSDADVALLEELLEFFDRFAVNNSADLGAETAAARERIGDIQQRLGRLAEADASYQQALQIYRRLAGEQPAEPTWMMAQVGVLHQQMIVAGRRGRGGQVVRLFEEARALLKQDATLERSAAGRFALAKLCNTVSSQGTRAALQPRLRALVRVRPSRGAVPAVASVREQRLRREAAANRTAHALLESLVAEDPENVSYRLALARTLRERARIAAVGGKDTAARDALAAAVATLEALSKQFPDANAFRYELAETLRLSFIVTDRRTSRSDLQRALAICDALVAASPESIEYRFLRSGVLNRLALAVLTPRAPQKALELWQRALDDQRVVAGRHPEVVAYQIALARTMLRLLDAYSLVEHRQEALALVDGVLESLRAYRGRATGPKRRRQRLDPLLDRLQQQRDDLAAQPIAER